MLKRLFPVLLAAVLVMAAAPARAELAEVVTLSGDDNIAAAIAISEYVHDDDSEFALTVFLARNDNFPDALASGPMQTDGPLLYTPTGSLDPRTRAEINRVNPDSVTILGGEQAVSAAVEAEIRAEGYHVERVNGADRIDTAVKLAESKGVFGSFEFPLYEVKIARAFPVPGSVDTTPGFVDSLGLGVANDSELVYPVLLSHTDALSPATAGFLEAARNRQGEEIQRALVAGGSQALSDRVLADVDARVASARRLAGANRYETAAAIAASQEERPDPVTVVILADGTRGDSWAPGFSAASLEVYGNTALVLSSGTEPLPAATRSYLESFDGNQGNPFILVCLPYVSQQACEEATSALP